MHKRDGYCTITPPHAGRIILLYAVFLFVFIGAVSAQTRSPKRGICGDVSPQDLAILAPSVTWYYDWSVEPPAVSLGQLSGIEWVPMAWNAPADLTDFESRIPAGSLYLLGFNEPNFMSQANMTPAQARYVRVYSHSRISQYGNSIREFEIFGTLKTAIEETSVPGTISVYPNPSDGRRVMLSFSGSWPEETVRVTVTNISGRVTGTEMLRVPGGGLAEFILPGGSSIKPGIYVVTITGEGFTWHSRLAINK